MWVVSCIPRQEPYGLPTDSLGRSVFVFNADLYHRAETAEGRNPGAYAVLGERLRQARGLTPGATYVLGMSADVPVGDGPIVAVREVAGLSADPTYADLTAYRRSTVQVTVCGRDEVATRRLAAACYGDLTFTNQQAFSARS